MNELLSSIKEDRAAAFTHSGKFHADDVFSSALLLYFNPELTIERGNQVPEDFKGIVYDIGRGRYDHHQRDSRVRQNGVPYAAFGLLWEELGAEILGEDLARRFDEDFVQPLDVNDNTGEKNEIATLIGDFNLVWDEEGNNDAAFFKAVRFAGSILENKFAKYLANERADKKVETFLKDQQEAEHPAILIMPQFVPYQKKLSATETAFVIFPSNRGGYCIQPLKKEGSMNYKCSFPAAWLGLEQEELQAATNLKSASFCHKGGFIMTVGELEDAVAACKMSLESYVSSPSVVHFSDQPADEPSSALLEKMKEKLSSMPELAQAAIKTIASPKLADRSMEDALDAAGMELEEWKQLQKETVKKILSYKPEVVFVSSHSPITYPVVHLLCKKKVSVFVEAEKEGKSAFIKMP